MVKAPVSGTGRPDDGPVADPGLGIAGPDLEALYRDTDGDGDESLVHHRAINGVLSPGLPQERCAGALACDPPIAPGQERLLRVETGTLGARGAFPPLRPGGSPAEMDRNGLKWTEVAGAEAAG